MKVESRQCDVCRKEKAIRTFDIHGQDLDCCSAQCWNSFWSKVWESNTYFPELVYPKVQSSKREEAV